MSLVVNHNMMAANVARNLNAHYGRLSTSTQRLSTGMRINSAADDAAGLAIRELQRADIAALHQGARNANDAISMIQVADGAMGVIDEKLIRMKELAEQAATGTYNSIQRLMIESEYQQMASEITRIANATDFNGVKLLDGTLAGAHDGSGLEARGAMKIHFGTGNDSAEDYYYIEIGNCTAWALGVGNELLAPKYARVRENVTLWEMRDALARGGADEIYEETFNSAKAEALWRLRQVQPPLTAGEIDRMSDDEARMKAQEAADTQRNAVASLVDDVYNMAYLDSYNRSFQAAVATGMGDGAAQVVARGEAEKAATTAVKDKLMEIASTGAVNGVFNPPRTRETFEAILQLMADEVEQGIYVELIGNGALLADVTNAVQTAFGATSTRDGAPAPVALAPEEMDQIYEQVEQIVRAKAREIATQNDILGNLRELVAVDQWPAPTRMGWDALYTAHADAIVQNAHPATVDGQVLHAVATQRAFDEGMANLRQLAVDGHLLVRRDAVAGTIPGDNLFDDAVDFDIDVAADFGRRISFLTTKEFTDTAGGHGGAAAGAVVGVGTQLTLDLTGAARMEDITNAAALAGRMEQHIWRGFSHETIVKAAEKVLDELTEYPAGATISTQAEAQRAIEAINEAIVSKDKIRAHLGALQNRLENTITNLNVQAENMQASESRISDVDVATEMTEFTRNQILTQSAVAMLAQANSLPQMALQLLGG